MAQKRVIVYDLGRIGGMLPDQLVKRIEFLQNILNEIPEEHRDTALVFEDTGGDDDCPYLEYRISYWRPETEAELKLNASMKQTFKKQKVEQDKIALADLMKRYPVAVQVNLNKENNHEN